MSYIHIYEYEYNERVVTVDNVYIVNSISYKSMSACDHPIMVYEIT